MIEITKPLYALSRKEYAGGEVVYEFIVMNNIDVDAKFFLTLKQGEEVRLFKLGKEYDVGFKLTEGKENNGK